MKGKWALKFVLGRDNGRANSTSRVPQPTAEQNKEDPRGEKATSDRLKIHAGNPEWPNPRMNQTEPEEPCLPPRNGKQVQRERPEGTRMEVMEPASGGSHRGSGLVSNLEEC